MTRSRSAAVLTAVAVLVLAACTSSALAVQFTTSYTDGGTWNVLYAQGFKASVNPSPDPGYSDPAQIVHLDQFQFVKSGLIDGASEATNVQLAIVDNFFIDLTTFTTSSPELVGMSTNTIADTSTIATGDPITFNFDGLEIIYGEDTLDTELDNNYAAIFVNDDGSGNLSPVFVPAMTADYVETSPGSNVWVPESDYGDPTGNYFLAASNYQEGGYLKTFNDYYADASFIATFDIEALAGDYNGDGSVDAADYTVWRDGLGTTYVEADYNVWKDNFGKTAGAGAGLLHATSAVPEPATALLASWAAMMLLAVGRHRSRGTCG